MTPLGVLDEHLDLFFARQEQLEHALAADAPEPWQVFAAQVRHQKAAYLADQARRPEWILGQGEAEAGGECAESGGVLTGLAGSPGVAAGPVFLVLTPEDFATFPKGA